MVAMATPIPIARSYPVPGKLFKPLDPNDYDRTGYSDTRGGLHRAVDIGVATIVNRRADAAWKGVVVDVGNVWGSAYGNQVLIRHRGWHRGRYRTWYSFYAHLADIDVRVGQKLRAGDKIGWCGNTGNSEAPHLHYELHAKPYWSTGAIYNPYWVLEPCRKRQLAERKAAEEAARRNR